MKKNGVIMCEESQVVTLSFREKGFNFKSCDILESSGGSPEYHLQGDALQLVDPEKYDFIGAHPPCPYLSNSGVRWLASRTKKPGFEWSEKYQIFINIDRFIKMVDAAMFFVKTLEYVGACGLGYVENPILHKYAMEIIKIKPTQTIHPYQFGHTEKKATNLWLVGLPKLVDENNVYDKMMLLDYKDRAKVHYCHPGPDRQKIRSKTYTGIAKGMANQWSKYI